MAQVELLTHGRGMNAEAVVIECLRGNASLCSDSVGRDVFETFGKLLNAADKDL